MADRDDEQRRFREYSDDDQATLHEFDNPMADYDPTDTDTVDRERRHEEADIDPSEYRTLSAIEAEMHHDPVQEDR